MQKSQYFGIYRGVVTNVGDPEKRGRLKAKCPDVLGDGAESAWAEPCVPVCHDRDGGADFCLPYVNEAVWLMFIGGRPNRPVWLGGWWSKESTPLGAAYERPDDTRVLSYKDFKITVHGDECVIENECDHTEAGMMNRVVLDSKGISISTSGGISISAAGDVSIRGAAIRLN